MAKQPNHNDIGGRLLSLEPRHFAFCATSDEDASPRYAVPVNSIDLAIAPAGVVSSPLAAAPLKTVSCLFERGAGRGEPEVWKEKHPQQGNAGETQCALPRAPRYTRIRPPRDVVKLEDRLRLLLQPPLETLLAARALRFA